MWIKLFVLAVMVTLVFNQHEVKAFNERYPTSVKHWKKNSCNILHLIMTSFKNQRRWWGITSHSSTRQKQTECTMNTCQLLQTNINDLPAAVTQFLSFVLCCLLCMSIHWCKPSHPCSQDVKNWDTDTICYLLYGWKWKKATWKVFGVFFEDKYKYACTILKQLWLV